MIIKIKLQFFIVFDNKIWNDYFIVMKLMAPLMRLLHIVDLIKDC